MDTRFTNKMKPVLKRKIPWSERNLGEYIYKRLEEENLTIKDLDESTIKRLKNAASTLGHKELIITGNNNLINLSVSDSQNSTANSYTIDVDGTYESEMFKFILDFENLKILNCSYDVNISSKLISNLINKDTNIQYWIALEKTSNYGG